MSISNIGAEDLEITLFGMELGVWRDPRQKKTNGKQKERRRPCQASNGANTDWAPSSISSKQVIHRRRTSLLLAEGT